MEDDPQSWKPLTVSASNSKPTGTVVSEYAAQRARLLLGCYRSGEANDPITYVTSVAATLAHFPEEVITAATDPVTGLPSKSTWLPTIKEVFDTCIAIQIEQKKPQELQDRRRKQLEERDLIDQQNATKPTMEQLKAKYGEHFGLDPDFGKPKAKKWDPAPSWDQIVKAYQAEPSRIVRLAGAHKRLRGEED